MIFEVLSGKGGTCELFIVKVLANFKTWLKIRVADPGSGAFLTRGPGWKKFGFGIRDKHPGSATLLKL
jgi:hypothetical protein